MIALLAIYSMVGAGFVWRDRFDIIANSPIDEDRTLTALKWMFTWPWWAFRRA